MSSLQELYDEVERLFNEQIPPNLHELPFKLMESVERIGNELLDTLQVYGPPSISLPLPPFFAEAPPPAPPPPPPPQSLITRIERYATAHPYALAGYVVGGAVGVTAVGLGVRYALADPRARALWRREEGAGLSDMRDAAGLRARRAGMGAGRRNKLRGDVQDGFLKDAVVLLSPSPLPALLIPFACSLLNGGYIVLVVVPHAKEAERVEAAISAIVEAQAMRKRPGGPADATHGTLRVLCYDPEDASSLGPFQRSLWATLSLRFPAPTSSSLSASQTLPGRAPGDPYAPLPTHQLPTLRAVLSLYALHPSPSPSGAHALPALPSILRPATAAGELSVIDTRRAPALVTFLPATAVLRTPETFAQQVIAGAQITLAENLAVAIPAVTVAFVSVGEIDLPRGDISMSGSMSAYDEKSYYSNPLAPPSNSTGLGRAMRSAWSTLKIGVYALVRPLGIGADASAWGVAERTVLRVVKSKRSRWWSIGRGSYTPRLLQKLLPSSLISAILSRAHIASFLRISLPAPVSAIDTAASTHSLHSGTPSREQQSTPRPGESPPLAAEPNRPLSMSSFGESDVDSEDVDRISVSTGSGSASGRSRGGLDGSWIGLDVPTDEQLQHPTAP